MQFLKRISHILIIVLIIFPLRVKANIRCNDGTYSASCSDCHRGCCSHHGGCASNYSSSSYSGSNGGGVIRTLKSSDEGNSIGIKDIIVLVIGGCFISTFKPMKTNRKRRRY